MSAAKCTLVSCGRFVLSQGVKPMPVYLPMAQIRPVAKSSRVASGVAVAVSTACPSA